MVAGDEIAFSLIVPVYRNEDNIRDLIEAIDGVIAPQAGAPFEVVFVVDGSPDRSGDLLRALLGNQIWPSQLITLSRNFGASAAIRTGLAHARGRAVAVMAADLQDPPEVVPRLWDMLAGDEADIVFGERAGRHDGIAARLASGLFWWLYRKIAFGDAPKGGASLFAFNARVKEAVLGIRVGHQSLFGLLMWLGFRRRSVAYVRQARGRGRSGYSLGRKLAYALDSLASFSDRPIMLQVWLSLAGAALCVLIGLAALAACSAGWTPAGNVAVASMLAVALPVLLLSQAILGLYVWRVNANTAGGPLAIISERLLFGTGRPPGD